MKKIIWGWLILAVSYAWSAVYYVSPSGSDQHSGSVSQPWRTPGYGSRQLHPGDTLMIRSGRYILSEYDADIIQPPSGSAEAWITIMGERGGRPILAGRDNLLTAIDLSGAEYVRIQNLEITNDHQAGGEHRWFREGVEILGRPAAHIVLENLYIHHVDEYGMNLQDIYDLQIIGCRIEYCGFGALGGPAAEQGGWRQVVIRDCSLSWSGHYYQGGDGSNRPYDRPDGFGIEPSAGPIVIEGTLAAHNYGDGLDSKAAQTIIRRCVVANNSCDGIKLWGPGSRIENTLIYGRGDGDPTPSPWAAIVIAPEEQANARFDLINITVDDQVGENYLMYVQYDHPQVPVQINIRNSIFCGRGRNCPIYINPAGRLKADHNLFYLPQSAVVITHGDKTYAKEDLAVFGDGNLYGDPRFIKAACGEEGDYHLQPTSPAINAGTSLEAPTNDLDGKVRDLIPDIGAYEFSTNVGITMPTVQPATFDLFPNHPNPFNTETIILFSLSQRMFVSLVIYDLLGHIVATLMDGEVSAGRHEVKWSAAHMPSGVYFARLLAADGSQTRKLVLVR